MKSNIDGVNFSKAFENHIIAIALLLVSSEKIATNFACLIGFPEKRQLNEYIPNRRNESERYTTG
jgi:hypothetical protein